MKIKLPKNRVHVIHEPTFNILKEIPPEKWTPIVVHGDRLIDGLQRFLIAQRLGYKEILVTYCKGS